MEHLTCLRHQDGAIQLASKNVLLTASCMNRIAKLLVDSGEARRQTPNSMATLFADLEDDVFDGDGQWMDLHDTIISDAFGDNETFRWLSDIRRLVTEPMRRAPNKNLLLRIQLLVLYFFLKNQPIFVDLPHEE